MPRLATGKLLDRSFDIIGIMVYTVLIMRSFIRPTMMNSSPTMNPKFPCEATATLVPAEASRMLAWNLISLIERVVRSQIR